MRIGIMCLNRNRGLRVSELLAERLNLKVVTSWEEKGMDDVIVCNNFFADVLDGITIALYDSIIGEPKAVCIERSEEKVFDKDALLKKDIFMDISGCADEYVTEAIVCVLRNGKTGYFLNPSLVLPSSPETIDIESVWQYGPASMTPCTVYMCGDSYRLASRDLDAYDCLRRKELMQVDIMREEFDIPSREVLKKAGDALGISFETAIKFYEALLYSKKSGFDNVTEGYINAVRSAAKPWQYIHSVGIQVL